MKGVILAGGRGSRLFPITKVVNKNLLPIYNKPAIYYPIKGFSDAGIKDICIVAEENHISQIKSIVSELLTDLEVNITYISDDHTRKGPAQALYYAKNFVGDDNLILAFADNNFDFDFHNTVNTFKSGAKLFVKEVSNPSSFGVLSFDKNKKINGLDEKPKNPKSNIVLTGLSVYDNNVFDYIERIKPGLNGEYYLTDVNLIYLQNGGLDYEIINGFWEDLGTFDGLATCVLYWYNKNKKINSI